MEDKILLSISRLGKVITDKTGYSINLFDDINFQVQQGEVLSLLAPLGSGKTTLLKIIAGIDNQTDGEVTCPNEHELPKISFIPSEPSSFPWLSVTGNIKFANESLPVEELKRIIELVGLEGYEEHFPDNNSFGFRLRISLARALAQKPEMILLDEPFTAIDKKHKNDVYALLRKINEKESVTFILATTNISEALLLSDRIIAITGSPSTVANSFDIKYSSIRNSELFDSPEFKIYKEDIEKTLLFSANTNNLNFLI